MRRNAAITLASTGNEVNQCMKHKRSLSVALAAIMLLSLCAVYATTSVSAVTSDETTSKASTVAEPASTVAGEGIFKNAATPTTTVVAVEAKNSRVAVPTPDLTGSPIAAGTGPASCIRYGTNDMYVFVKGSDGACWYRIWSTTTLNWVGGWVRLGGSLTSSPTASSSTENSLASMSVFWRHTDGSVHGFHNSGGTWSAEYTPGGNLGYVSYGTGPAVAKTPNRVDLFVKGSSGLMYKKTWTNTAGWSDWKYIGIGGVLGSSPTAASRESSYVEVAVRGTNGAVYGYEYSIAGNWWATGYVGGGVAAGTAPAICTYGSVSAGTFRMDFFVAGTNGYMYQKTYKSVGGWTGWTNLVGGLETTPCATTFTYSGTVEIDVFTRGTNGYLYQKEYYNGAWHNWYWSSDGPTPM